MKKAKGSNGIEIYLTFCVITMTLFFYCKLCNALVGVRILLLKYEIETGS